MKRTLVLIGIIALAVVACVRQKVVSTSINPATGQPVYTTNLVTTVAGITIDAPHTASAIRNAAPPLIRLAIADYPETKAYFVAVDVVIQAAISGGTYDAKVLAAEVDAVGAQFNFTDPHAKAAAVAGVESAFGLYKAYAGDVVTAKLNTITWLAPVLPAVHDALVASLTP